jgi:hypothetical protein
MARAETVEEEAARNLHGGEAEEEGARKRAQGFRPIVTLEARKKWLAT